uniref:Uncharacterized protein n=1 Tax=Stomoxys calcitrans TaxID=35570 RepID=A0A1I8PUC6_STOCA
MSKNFSKGTKAQLSFRPSWRTTNDAISKLGQQPLVPTTTMATVNAKNKAATKTHTTIASKWRKTAKTIITFIAAYFEDSNIHGLKYVVKRNLTTIEKCFWLMLLIISVFFCVQVCMQSVDRYYTKSTVMGLERNFHYFNTTLPSVTICPLQRLNDELYKEYIRQYNLTDHESKELFNLIEHLANSTYINFRNLPNNRSTDKLFDRIGITPNLYMELIYNLTGDDSMRTEEDLFEDKVHSNSGTEIILEARQILTEYGLCYVTNTDLSDKYSSRYMILGEVPHNYLRGRQYFRKVIHTNYFSSDTYYHFRGFGIKPIDSFVHSTYEVMQLEHNLGYSNTPYKVLVDSVEITTDEGLEIDTTVDQRKCRFQHESNLTHFPIYTRNLCLQECRLNLVHDICKCIPHFYPNRIPNPKPVCHYRTLLECFAENEKYFIKLYKINGKGKRELAGCYCMQNCRDAIINKVEHISLPNADFLFGGNSFMFVLEAKPTYRLKRLVVFTFTELLVSIGGIAGFFLGFSVLCLVELIYYFILKLICFALKKIL